jgi:NhaA family Na+:H+ antiporter
MKVTKLFKEFFESEKSGGIILIFCTLISIVLANTSFGDGYISLFHFKFLGSSIEHWVNDGLMTIFFLLIGLELEREIYIGELSKIKDASLPIFGALGGMIVPAMLFLFFNFGTESQSGAGIPMATDIAFAIGILSLLGNRVPISLKIFLTALAVIDDLGAIIVIAIFYTKEIVWFNVLAVLLILLILFVFNRLKVKSILVYLIGGIFMWFFMLKSGIHATITGVLLAFVIPFGNGDQHSTSYKLQHWLHKPVAYFILPLFALANTAIIFNKETLLSMNNNTSIGIFLGLFLGKPLGVFLFTYLATILGLSKLPKSINWKLMFGVGILAGIGFTMSIYVTMLAFDDNALINNSKLIVILSSLFSGVVGYIFLKRNLKS